MEVQDLSLYIIAHGNMTFNVFIYVSVVSVYFIFFCQLQLPCMSFTVAKQQIATFTQMCSCSVFLILACDDSQTWGGAGEDGAQDREREDKGQNH